MTLSDIELYDSLLARDETDRRFRFHAGIMLMVTGLLTVSRFIFGRDRDEADDKLSRGLIEEPMVMITLAGWGVGILIQFLEAHKRIDQQIGK